MSFFRLKFNLASIDDDSSQRLITLNRMKASEDLDQDQVRQLLFDLEGSYSAFYRSLSSE